MFVQRKNAATGELEWAVVDLEGGEDTEVVGDLLRSSLYLDMFNDERRNEAYRRAIDEVVRPGDLVLDIGTGTGLLALMGARAARNGSSTGKVVACEVFPPMVRAAKGAVIANGMQDSVTVLEKRSSDITVGNPGADMERKADVIVTEIFDSELLGEGVLPTMRHAVASLLKEGGRVVPAGATIWAQLVASPFLEQAQSDGGAREERFVRPLHVDPLFPQRLSPLSKPFRVFDFAFAHPPEGQRHTTLQVEATASGRLVAVVVWWELSLGAAGALTIGTAPAWVQRDRQQSSSPGVLPLWAALQPQQWRDHWKACWAPVGPQPVGQGDALELDWRHYDYDISVTLAGPQEPGTCPARHDPSLGLPAASGASWEDALAALAAGEGELLAVGVSLPDLFRTQRPLGAIEGFDMACCNRLLGASPSPVLRFHSCLNSNCGSAHSKQGRHAACQRCSGRFVTS